MCVRELICSGGGAGASHLPKVAVRASRVAKTAQCTPTWLAGSFLCAVCTLAWGRDQCWHSHAVEQPCGVVHLRGRWRWWVWVRRHDGRDCPWCVCLAWIFDCGTHAVVRWRFLRRWGRERRCPRMAAQRGEHGSGTCSGQCFAGCLARVLLRSHESCGHVC
jgi:hypothetical protein